MVTSNTNWLSSSSYSKSKAKTMTASVRTEKELADAINRGEDTIEITGDLVKKTIKLRATGRVAWAVAFAAIGLAVYAAITTGVTGGTSTPVTGPVAAITGGAAVGILGGAATYSAIAIAIAAGGIGALTKLRGYKEVSRAANSLILKRK
jgi:hypothetical protein